jgi:hypothetical protein
MALSDILPYSTDFIIEGISKTSVGVLGDIINSDMLPYVKISDTHSGSLLDILAVSPAIEWIHKDQGITRNQPYYGFEFVMRDSTDHLTPKVGLTVTAQRAIDNGSFSACANSVSAIGDGVYKIDLSSSDLNGTFVMLIFSATDADTVYVLIKTTTVPTDIGFRKNTAYPYFMFLIRSSTNHVTPAVGLTVVAERSIDGGVFGICTNPVVEKSLGVYVIDLSIADLSGGGTLFKFTASGGDPVYLFIKTNQ